MSSGGSSTRRSRSPRCVVASISCGSPPSLVPEIYVTQTDAKGGDCTTKIPGMDVRRDSSNSNLSCSLPNLASDDLDLELDVALDDLDVVGGSGATTSTNTSLYCSPLSARRSATGPAASSAVGDTNLTGRRHNGQPNYPFLKCVGSGKQRQRVESTDSNESDCSASHLSTCATSDYTHLTSLDMINILSMREQYHPDTGPQTLASNMDLTVEYGTLRRTHSNPENCALSEEENKNAMESSESSLRDSKSCTNLEAEVSVPLAEHRHGNHLRAEVQHPSLPRQTGSVNPEVDTALLHPGSKPLAVSEENLHSRVNRWLGNVDTDKEQPKSPANAENS